ncbi:MAG: hypothetical protein U5K79_01600 [Cyclobacteriaceae bacterium]|nr:hypothetical protein [Cyclobacteriaceae bacterium]
MMSIQNLQKIHHHGQRQRIVKRMLEHSRTSSGKMEPTDINKLADEYLRLAYHGFRAKDKSCTTPPSCWMPMKKLPKSMWCEQDIGRVLLSLINNAFYAVDKKAKEDIDGYKPVVHVYHENKGSPPSERSGVGVTFHTNHRLRQRPRYPEAIKDKIFQPFFNATKRTGSGTGLGLSLSYDIAEGTRGRVEGRD